MNCKDELISGLLISFCAIKQRRFYDSLKIDTSTNFDHETEIIFYADSHYYQIYFYCFIQTYFSLKEHNKIFKRKVTTEKRCAVIYNS